MSTQKTEVKKSVKPPRGKLPIGELEVKAVSKRIKAVNLGPIHEWEDEFHVGINLVSGGAGVGKSNLIDWIASVGGAGLPLSVRDGANAGQLVIDGSVVLDYQRKKGKQQHVSLASVSSAALVVNPGIKDPASAEDARLKHLLTMVRAESTEEMVEFFLTAEPKGDEEPRLDAEAYDYVDSAYGIARLLTLDPVAVADVLIKGGAGLVHKLKREYGDKAKAAHARWQVAHPEKPAQLSETDMEQADGDYRKAVGDHRQVQGEASQRAAREKERAEIEATLGDRPDVAAAVALFEDAKESFTITSRRVTELEKQLAVAKADQETCGKAVTRTNADAGTALSAAEQWDRRNAILETPITGATEADVQKASQRVESAKAELELARATAEYNQRLKVADEARKERDKFQNREAEVAALADRIPARLGAQFGRLGIPGARVKDGVLQVKNEAGKLEDFERRSEGQKWDWILPIYLAHNPGGLVAHPKHAWFELEQEMRIEVAEAHVRHGCIGVVEVSTFHGDPLHVEQFQG